MSPTGRGVPEQLLFRVAEPAGQVACERAVIRRIAIDEVAGPWFDRLERPSLDFGPSQCRAGLTQPLGIANPGVLVAALGHIELPGPVHPIQTVVAGLVEVDEPRSHLERSFGFLGPDPEVVALVCMMVARMLPQRVNQVFHVVPDHPVGRDQFEIDIRQERLA